MPVELAKFYFLGVEKLYIPYNISVKFIGPMMFNSEQPNTVGRETRFYRTFKYSVIICTHVWVL